MTPDDLEKLLAKATPGPWESHGTICCPDRGWVTTQETGHAQPTHAFSIADAEMVAALHNLAPALLRLWRAALMWDADPECADDITNALIELENHR
jgi:hypothetical protein